MNLDLNNTYNKEKATLTKNEKLLRYAPIPKLFLRYSLPGVIGLLFFGLQSISDAIIVGNFLGANSLASVNIVLPISSFIAVIAIMLGIGAQTVISIGFGENDYKKAQNALTTGYISLLVFCTILAAITLSFPERIMGLLGANDLLMNDSVNYLWGFVPFIPMIVTLFFNDYILKALGRPHFAMSIMTSIVLINIALSIIFISILKMGTYGVGLATGISFSIGAIVSSVVTMNKRKNRIAIFGGKFNFRLLWQMLYNGSSEGMSEFAIAISMMLFNITLMSYAGADGVAAFTAINYTHFVGSTLFLGISDGVIPILSYNYGARNRKRIKETFFLAVKTNAVIGFIIFLTLFLFGGDIVSIFFSNGSPQVLELASTGARIYAFAFLLAGFNILSTSFFTAIADAKISIIIASLRGLIFIAIGLQIFPKFLDINGIWISVPIAELLTFIVSIALIRMAIKKKLRF